MTALYKPLGMVLGVLGGVAAGAIFRRMWRALAHEDEAPKPHDPDRRWGEIAAAAAVEGAVFGGVRALVDRAGAAGFARATGRWPS